MLSKNAKMLFVLFLLFMVITCGQAVCTQAAAQTCLMGSSDTTALGSIVEQCRSVYPVAEDCLRRIIAECGSSDADRAVVGGIGVALTTLDHLCSEQFIQEYAKHVACLDSPVVVSEIEACNTRLATQLRSGLSSLDAICSVVHRVRACLAIAVSASCGAEAAEVIDELATFSLESVLASVLPSCNVREPLHKYCYPNPCFNGGDCNSQSGQPVCTCKKGFEGPICDTVAPDTALSADCQTAGCLNDGHCVVESSRYSCLCSTGYTGIKCETPLANNKNQSNVISATGLTTVAIVGIVLGVVTALLFVIVVTLMAICRLRLTRKQRTDTNNTVENPTSQQPPQNPGWQQLQQQLQMTQVPQTRQNNPGQFQPTAPDLLQQQLNMQIQQNALLLMQQSHPPLVQPPRLSPDPNDLLKNTAQTTALSPAAVQEYLKVYAENPQAMPTLNPYSQPRDMETIMSEIWRLQSQVNASGDKPQN